MPAVRLFDCFNGFIGSTQVVGVETFGASYGKRVVASNNDGMPGVAARDRTAFYAQGDMRCQGISQWPALLQLFLANETQDIRAEGKTAGSAVESYKATLKRAKLVSSQLSLQQGSHANCSFNFRNSAASASVESSDEVTVEVVGAKSVTYSTGLRSPRLVGASFSVGPLVPLGVTGIDISVQGQGDQTYGDAEFGEIYEVLGYDITGVLTLKDMTISGDDTIGQRLLDAAVGTLTLTYAQQAAAANKTLAIANLTFEEDVTSLAARKLHQTQLRFGVSWQNSSGTVFQFAGGSNNIFVVT